MICVLCKYKNTARKMIVVYEISIHMLLITVLLWHNREGK